MHHSPIKTAMSVLLTICLVSAMLLTPAYAAGTIYINDGENPVPNAFEGLYAVGGDGEISAIQGETLYAMTGDGLKPIKPEVPATAPPAPTVTPEPQYEDIPPAYDTVKVGLYYGSGALTEARLENAVGSGYLFGYYDNNRQFHEVGSTDVRTLTMIADLNTTTEAETEIGCYHILLPSSYSSFQAAYDKASEIGGFPAYYNGSYFVLYGHYKTTTETEEAMTSSGINGTVFSASSRCVVVTETGTDRILFEFDYGSAHSLAIRPVSEEGKAVTWFKQNRYHGDFQYARLTSNEYLTVVNYVEIEDYVQGVLPFEMPATWPLEALKAQAMCARNYVATNFNTYRSQGFDVTNDTYCQVYRGVSDLESVRQAAEATAGKYVRYQGKICQTFFFSSDGGATESSENVWGSAIPYLIGVEDPYEEDVETYMKNWTYTKTPEELRDMVNDRLGCKLGVIASVEAELTEMENIKALTFKDVKGKTHKVINNRCVYAVNANSPRFTIEKDEDGNFVITGSGWGHNCGLSQYGAYSMALHHEKTAEEIIQFYFTGGDIR